MDEKEPEHSGHGHGPKDDRIEAAGLRGALEGARKTEEAWRLLMESVKDFAILLVDTEGRIASWNEGAARLLGYASGEIAGEPLSRLYVPEDIARNLPAEELRKAGSNGRSTGNNWLLRKDGSRFWADGPTTALRDTVGNLLGYAKVVRDLTDQKLFEESLRKANETLEERVESRTRELDLRIRELEGFSSIAAHDLRAPLRVIHRYAEVVLADYRGRTLDQAGQDFLGRIVDAARKMDVLIEHLLSFSRLTDQRLKLRAVELGAIVEQVLEALALDLLYPRPRVEVEHPLPDVLVDPAVLSQALTNILSNALKFIPQGIEPRVRIRAHRRGRGVRLEIEDNGVGIAPQNQERIFLPFERVHSQDEYPGTGMGLAIVKKAAERMGGTVGVESTPGRGSCFWIDLPTPDEG